MACIAIRLATQIYDAAGHYQYCDSPVIADASGNLYYINDSGTLFKLGAVESWTVAFNSNGGSACDTKFVATADGKLVKPADPTRDGYTFGGWFTDEACTQAYDFSTPVTADLTLYAKWTKNAVNPGGNGGSGTNGGNGGAGNGSGAGTGTGSGSGTKGQQAGGAIAPGHKPTTKTTVSTKTETKDNKSDKKDTDKSDKKDEKKSDKKSDKKDSKSDKKSDSKSDTGAASTTTAKKSSSASEQETGTNPLAIVGVAAGVIGLAIVGVFVFTKRR